MEIKKLEDQLKSIVYIAAGAVSTIAEKAMEIAGSLEEKGKEACEKSKISNEELKRNLKDTLKKAINVTVIKDTSTEEFVENMQDLSAEDLAKIKEKIAEIEKSSAKEKVTEEEAGANEKEEN